MTKTSRTISLVSISAISLSVLTGCDAQEIAQVAADAAACRAGESVIAEVQAAYEAGLVDSGVLTLVDSLIGDQVDALLSSELAGLFSELRTTVAATAPVEETAAKVSEINQEISARCSEVGVDFSSQ